MISEQEFSNYEEIRFLEESETIKNEVCAETIYKLIEKENIYEIFPTYDLQDAKLAQDILEVYKILFWGTSAIVSTLLWLYFFLT